MVSERELKSAAIEPVRLRDPAVLKEGLDERPVGKAEALTGHDSRREDDTLLDRVATSPSAVRSPGATEPDPVLTPTTGHSGGDRHAGDPAKRTPAAVALSPHW